LLLFQLFDTTSCAGTPRAVDFAQIIVDISVGTFLPPQMPPTFFTLTSKLAPLEAPSPLLPAPAPVPRITPKPEPVPQPSPPGVGSIVINPAGADATLFARLEGKQIREVIRNEVMPVNAANVPMCLTYHARGQCYSNCRRVADHNKRHSDAEQRTWWLLQSRQFVIMRLVGLPLQPLLLVVLLLRLPQLWGPHHPEGGQGVV